MRLTLKLPDGKILKKDFKEASVVIGRSSQANMVVGEDYLSRFHAKIENIGGNFFVSDLNSANGVFLDGKRIQPGVRTPFALYQHLQIAVMDCFVEEAGTQIQDLTPLEKTSSVSEKVVERRVPLKKMSRKKKNIFYYLYAIILILGGLTYFHFHNRDESSLDSELLLYNVPEKLRLVKDDFLDDYNLVKRGCPENLCQEMNLKIDTGEGVLMRGHEVVVFLNSANYFEKEKYTKIKKSSRILEFIALDRLFESTLLEKFREKKIAQIHLVLLKDQVPFKVLRLHLKYFTSSDLKRVSSLLFTTQRGEDEDPLWTFLRPLIKIKNL